MNCQHCGKKLPVEGATFCSFCGKEITLSGEVKQQETEKIRDADEKSQWETTSPKEEGSNSQVIENENSIDFSTEGANHKNGNKKFALICMVAVLTLVLCAVAFILFRSSQASNVKLYSTVEDIWMDYYDNKAAASELYNAKYVCVSGVVVRVEQDYVVLKYSDSYLATYSDTNVIETKCVAKNKSDLTTLNVGNHISAFGTVKDGDNEDEYYYTIQRATFGKAFDVATMIGRGTNLQDTIDRSDFLSNTADYSGKMIGLNCEITDISYTTIEIGIAGEFSYGDQIGSKTVYTRFKIEGDNSLIDVGDAFAKQFSVGDKVYVDGECFYLDGSLLILNPNIVIVEKADTPERDQTNVEDFSSSASEILDIFCGAWIDGDYSQQVYVYAADGFLDMNFAINYGESIWDDDWWTGWSLSVSASEITKEPEGYSVQGQAWGFDSSPFNVKITIEKVETRADIFEYLMYVETDSYEFPGGTFRWSGD